MLEGFCENNSSVVEEGLGTDGHADFIFSSVAAWEYGTLINIEKGLFFQSNSALKERKN